jgi:hypothetical protein
MVSSGGQVTQTTRHVTTSYSPQTSVAPMQRFYSSELRLKTSFTSFKETGAMTRDCSVSIVTKLWDG